MSRLRGRPGAEQSLAKLALMSPVDTEVMLTSLARKSIAKSTTGTYDSRLRVLARFLGQMRGVSGDCDPLSCSREEFAKFLGFLSDVRGTTGASTLSAFKLELEVRGLHVAWTRSEVITRAVKGVAAEATRSVRMPLTAVQLRQLKEVVLDMNVSCAKCERHMPWVARTSSLLRALDVLLAEPLRPGDLVKLRISDVATATGEGLLRVSSMKTRRAGLMIVLSEAGATALRAAEALARNEAGNKQCFLFPACVHTHLNQAFRVAKRRWGWDAATLLSAHSCRHSMMSEKRRQLVDLHGSVACNVVPATFAHYSAPEAERLAKKRRR